MAPMIFINKSILLFLIISPLFLSTFAVAGRPTQFVDKLDNQQFDATHQEVTKSSNNMEEERMINERILRANNKDYGNPDPPPALVRPPYKLIPN